MIIINDYDVIRSVLSYNEPVQITYYGYGEDAANLRGLMENYNKIPLNVKLSILDDIYHSLRYLHRSNPPIVHRDLTPNNILLRVI